MSDQSPAQTVQAGLINNKFMVYFTTGTVLALELPASLFLVYLVYLSVTKYKAEGLSLWLLIGLTASIFSYATANIFGMIGVRRLIIAD